MKTFAALALLVLLGLPTLAQAQQTEYTEDQKWYLASAQLVASLESPIETVRTQSLKNAIIYATLYRDKIDLSQAVPALRMVYEDDQRSVHRKLALAALQAIGTNRAADYVARYVSTSESEEGRIVMASVLNDFYLSRTSASASSAASLGSSTLR